jgi:hypothetical protein
MKIVIVIIYIFLHTYVLMFNKNWSFIKNERREVLDFHKKKLFPNNNVKVMSLDKRLVLLSYIVVQLHLFEECLECPISQKY